MKNKCFFFCTTPLQYFNCTNLACNNGSYNILFIVNRFPSAFDFHLKVKQFDRVFDDVIFIENKKDKVLKSFTVNLKDKIYVHSDLHFELDFVGGFKGQRVIMYEEGLGTYQSKITKITKSYWKNLFVKMISFVGLINSSPGAHRLTDAIFVYNKDEFDAKSSCNNDKSFFFNYSFFENYERNKNAFDKIFSVDGLTLPNNSKVCLFLTSNDKAIDFKKEFDNLKNLPYDHFIFKPHPNLGQASNYDISNNVMAEMLMIKLISNKNKVDVFHYGTAATLYVNSPSITFTLI